jgi:dihydroorotate dehydrogenase
MLYRTILRPLLFYATQRDPEIAHSLTLKLLAVFSQTPALSRQLHRVWAVQDPALACTVFGLRFPNPVGLAAGFDKDGVAVPAWAAMGFGHVEVGTVTWHAQPGNPRPRVFRLGASQALINRMGFNNHGAAALAQRLRRMPAPPNPIGISLGKSRRTPLEEAIDDYRASLRELYAYGDYFAINVSSPNTPGLRSLQDRAQLEALLAALQQEAAHLAQIPAHQGKPVPPLLLKISPDLSKDAVLEILTVCSAHQISGIIATNTTLSREGLQEASSETGGLSGRPLAETARQMVGFISRETAGRLPIIGVGGIASPDDARRMLAAGASLVQIYTGLVYRGPRLVRAINDDLQAQPAHAADRQQT